MSTPAVCGSQPWPCPGCRDSDSENRKKDTVASVLPKALRLVLVSSQVWKLQVGQKNAF